MHSSRFDIIDHLPKNPSFPHKLNTMWQMVPRRVKKICGLTSLAVALTMGWAASPKPKIDAAAGENDRPAATRTANKLTPTRTTPNEQIDKQNLDYFILNDSAAYPQVEINKERLPQIIKLLEQQPDLAVKMLTKRWLEAYGGHRKEELIAAYQRCGTIIEVLKNKFRQAGWDENIAYLGIPESHWNNEAVSPANAVGIFQILPGTADLFKLLRTAEYDGRLDPEQAADLVIKHLNDTATRLKNRDIDINLAGYNSNMVNELLAAVRDNSLARGPQGRLTKVTPGRGDKITKINYSLYLKFLALKLRSLPINAQQWTKAHRELFSFIKENLEYPAKLFAIHELIETEIKNFPQLPAWQYTKGQFSAAPKNRRLGEQLRAQGINEAKFFELNPGLRNKRGTTKLVNLNGIPLRFPHPWGTQNRLR